MGDWSRMDVNSALSSWCFTARDGDVVKGLLEHCARVLDALAIVLAAHVGRKLLKLRDAEAIGFIVTEVNAFSCVAKTVG